MRYFLHIREKNQLIRDLEGTELPDIHAARDEARAALRDIVADRIRSGTPLEIRSVEICDENGEDVATVTLAAAISDVIPISEDTFEADLTRYLNSSYNPCSDNARRD